MHGLFLWKIKKALRRIFFYKLDDIVNNYNNTYHSTIKMKPVDVKSNIYIDSSKEINNNNNNNNNNMNRHKDINT